MEFLKKNNFVRVLLILLLYGLVIFFGNNLHSQNELQKYFDNLQNNKFYKHSSMGISVRDVTNGQLIASYQKDKGFVPASSLKLVTTLSAVDILGVEFCFQTKITHDGILENDGTLKGNIYIEGGGDPTLGSKRIPGVLSFEQLLEKLTNGILAYGIKCVDGDIIADESIFNSFPISPSWQWNDLGNYYASGAWGLNILENEYSIFFQRSGSVGESAKIQYFEPYVPDLKVENEVTIDTAGSGDNVYIFGGPYNFGKRAVGTVPQGKGLFKVRGSIPDPPAFLAFRLHKQFMDKNIGIQNFRTQYHADSKKDLRKEILKISSPSLGTIASYANWDSVNMYCESILKILGYQKGGMGSGQMGVAVIKKYLSEMGLDITPLHMEDGSGLSARNLISADLLTSFLVNISKRHPQEELFSLLPKTGKDGTVRSLLNNTKAQGNVWAKSGSMQKIHSFSGYILANSGRKVAYTVLLNGSFAPKSRDNRAELEKILNSIYKIL